MCASTVSSKMLAEIARVEGFLFEETLTGFKWIGSRAETLSREQGYLSLFCYEEALGFCCGNVVYDKDGMLKDSWYCLCPACFIFESVYLLPPAVPLTIDQSLCLSQIYRHHVAGSICGTSVQCVWQGTHAHTTHAIAVRQVWRVCFQ